MELTILLTLAAALSINEFLHVFAEVTSTRQKVARLSAYINKQPAKEMPIKIDTRLKSYAVSLVLFILITSLSFGLLLWLDLGSETLVKIIIGMLIGSYAVAAIGFDKYHVEIEKVTKPFMKKRK